MLPAHRRQNAWTRTSSFFLAINSLIEHAFLLALYSLVRVAPYCSLWSVLRFYALCYVDDALYTVYHAWLHVGWRYRAIHSHHHREKQPHRGYRDAGNENPVEQACALLLHLVAARVIRCVIGLDWMAILAHLTMKAAGSCLNHVNHAVVIHLGGGVILDTVYHHEHHSRGTVHFAQFVPAVDRLFDYCKRWISSRTHHHPVVRRPPSRRSADL